MHTNYLFGDFMKKLIIASLVLAAMGTSMAFGVTNQQTYSVTYSVDTSLSANPNKINYISFGVIDNKNGGLIPLENFINLQSNSYSANSSISLSPGLHQIQATVSSVKPLENPTWCYQQGIEFQSGNTNPTIPALYLGGGLWTAGLCK